MNKFKSEAKLLFWCLLFFCGGVVRTWAGDQEVRLGDPERLQREWGLPRRLEVIEPYSGQRRVAVGYPLPEVLDRFFAKSWRQSREFTFVARDGYRAVIPVNRITTHQAFLAFRFDPGKAGSEFKIRPPGANHDTELSPYYLVWENIRDKEMLAEKDHGWPYQVVAVELREREPLPDRWVPQAGDLASVRAGYAHFKSYCLSCHRLGGNGGSVGPELLTPVSVTTYWNRDWLAKWIAAPSSIRAGTPMPPFAPPVNEGQKFKMIEAILDYLAWAGARPVIQTEDKQAEDKKL